MPQGLQAVLALLILLPGFISARIVRMMNARSEQSELERVIEALIFSFVIYVLYLGAFGTAFPLDWVTGDHPRLIAHRGRILFLALIAVALGFGWGFVRGRDLILKALRRWKITERTSRESVWNDVFLSHSGTVQVGLADGRMVIGWLQRYSETGNERSVFLEKAAWVSEDGALVPINGAGLLLTDKAEIHFVMFLDK